MRLILFFSTRLAFTYLLLNWLSSLGSNQPTACWVASFIPLSTQLTSSNRLKAQNLPSPGHWIRSPDVGLQSLHIHPTSIHSTPHISQTPSKMANSRTLHLTSMWSLEDQGVSLHFNISWSSFCMTRTDRTRYRSQKSETNSSTHTIHVYYLDQNWLLIEHWIPVLRSRSNINVINM